MTTLAENFRAFLLADEAVAALVGQRIHHNRVPEESEGARVCYFRRQAMTERATDETSATPTMVSFDVECGGEDLSEAAELADVVRTALDGHRGTFGDQTVQGVFVEDHDEDYAPLSNDSDDVLHVATFQVEIFP